MQLAVVASLGGQILGLVHPQTEGVLCSFNVVLVGTNVLERRMRLLTLQFVVVCTNTKIGRSEIFGFTLLGWAALLRSSIQRSLSAAEVHPKQ